MRRNSAGPKPKGFGDRELKENRVRDFLLCKMPGMRAPFAFILGVFLALFLAGCAGEVPVPFLNAALPPAPPVVEGTRIPIMTEAEREAVEAQLKKLVQDREGSVKKTIDNSN
jgi:hypothetical protein